MDIRIIHPDTEEEFEKYHLLRWEILRKPWNQPKEKGGRGCLRGTNKCPSCAPEKMIFF